MKRNQIIRGALIISKLLILFLALFFILFVFVMTHSRFSPEFYESVMITEAFQAGYGGGNLRVCDNCNAGPYLNELTTGIVIWLISRTTIFLIITILILRTFIEILNSVNRAQTFYSVNIQNFKLLARYGAIASIFSAFNFSETDLFLTIPLGVLSFTFACLVLSEVFLEGKLLKDDKNSIV